MVSNPQENVGMIGYMMSYHGCVGIWTYSYYICTSIALIRFWTELTGGRTTPEVPHGS